MDGQEYLNQISANNKTSKNFSGLNKLFSSKFFIVGLIGVVLLVIIIAVGSLIGGNKTDTKNLSFALKLHLDNTSKVIDDYQPNVKSSTLRSSSSSLSNIISDTNKKLTDHLTEKYDFRERDISKNVIEEKNLEKDELESELFEAKINGNLDRIYAHKMAYEISLLKTEESRIINGTRDDELKNILTTSYDSLSILYDDFNNFSEAK